MLLRFSVTNFLSFQDNQEISLVASELGDTEEGLIDCPAVPGKRVIPFVIVSGANASGKTNLLEAIRRMRNAVLFSHTKSDPEGGVQRTPFALDPASRNANSVFDIDFMMSGIRYHYGFEASDQAFESEWLHTYPKGRRQILFTRKGQSFEFGRGLKGRNKVISDLTRPNSLFVSAAAQNDHTALLAVRSFFRSINGAGLIAVPGGLLVRLCDEDIDRRAISFLRKVGTGVTGFRRQEADVPEVVLEMGKAINTVLKKFEPESATGPELLEKKTTLVIELAHRGADGEDVFFEIDRESAGTRRLLLLLGPIFRALEEGTILVIDELDASLHTRACEAVLALFGSPESNRRGAQLIITTHDTNLLHSPLVRRDQVWFTETNKKGATELYALTDIRTRKGDNIEKGYLQGRYGAIPDNVSVSDLVHES